MPCAAHVPLFLYPFLNTTSKTRPFEYLRLTSLGVIGALVKVRQVLGLRVEGMMHGAAVSPMLQASAPASSTAPAAVVGSKNLLLIASKPCRQRITIKACMRGQDHPARVSAASHGALMRPLA